MRDRSRVLVVGGGILGTMHALSALDRGHEVIHLERDPRPRGASVRNFGLIWVSGRSRGAELALALVARDRWEQIATRCPEVGFRPNGSITIAQTPEELAVLDEAMTQSDATRRGFERLEVEELRHRNPALNGELRGGLFCALDAAVEPRLVPAALRSMMTKMGRYHWLPGHEICSLSSGRVVDQRGEVHGADQVFLCPGATRRGLIGELLAAAPLRRVRLQMLETDPLDVPLTTSLADGDSLRYYPAFDLPSRAALGAQSPLAAAHRIQLLCQQRLDGSLTLGDTHAYDEPFPFDLDDRASDYLLEQLSEILGRPAPRVRRRWAGIYSQLHDDAGGALYFRGEVDNGVSIVTGPGGRGMTLSPAIAEESFE